MTARSTNESNPTSGPVDAPADAGSRDNSSAPVVETDDLVRECRVDDDCNEQAPVCSDNRQCVVCLDHQDCAGTSRPYCKVSADEKNNRCVACQIGTDCGTPGSWECIDEQCFESCDEENAQRCGNGLVCVTSSVQAIQYCAECGPGAACADPDLSCVGNTCVVCDPENDTGCGEGEHCERPNVASAGALNGDAGAEARPSAARCVECRADHPKDCPGGACVDGACQVCDPVTNTGCGGDTPVCKGGEGDAGAITSVCVECTAPEHCVDSPAGAACVAERCAACDPIDNAGCSGKLGSCIDIAPPGAPTLYECRECSGAGSCEEGVCVDFSCVECATSQDCGGPDRPECTGENECGACTGDAACAHRPGAPVCDVQSGECVECNEEAQCAGSPATPACDTAGHRCVECTNSSHCPDNPGVCLTFPGEGQYTCAPDDTTPEPFGECSRCNADDCAPGLICAEYNGDQRCFPVAEPGAPCGPESLFSADGLMEVLVCIPEDCAE